MANKRSETNVIALLDHRPRASGPGDGEVDTKDVSEFIVDMLDALMKIAAKKDSSILLYLLSMAKVEAQELQKTEDTKEGRS
ncbi:MAG: hypothetical protein L3J67_10895 [Hyphomicrobiaceae bacterium]|nr:hypothetical protein [Hyphomicrobiaceae bacterium]